MEGGMDRSCSTHIILGLLISTVGTSGCDSHPVSVPGEAPAQVTPDTFSQSLNNKADILFMIDDSPSMGPMQNSLIQYFPNFMQPLKDLPSPPDLHIGIVTTDLGAGQFSNVPGCRLGGDQGLLQNTPKGPTCASAHLNNTSDRFLTYSPDPNGGAPRTNFAGDIGDAFACYAAVGETGCGFESPLGSPMVALQGCNTDQGCRQTANAGFLRNDAYLAVVLLTNEDDSSTSPEYPDTKIWDPSQTSANSVVGCLTSYRQVEFGVTCGGQPIGRAPGPRQDCEAANPESNPDYMEMMPDEFAAFFKGLKVDPRMVYVSAITGPPQPVAVGTDQNGCPQIQPSCTGGPVGNTWSAAPGIHFAKFISDFDSDRASFISICQQDLKQAMEQIATELAKVLGTQCLSAPLVDKDPSTPALDPECVVEDRSITDASAGTADISVVPPCDPVVCDPASAPNHDCKCQSHQIPAGAPGCWYVWPDAAECAPVPTGTSPAQATSVGSGYQIRVDRGIDASCKNPPAPPNTTAVVQCSSCIADPAQNSFDCSPGCSQYWPTCCASDTPQPGCYP
jgi:hypothetical protein